MIKNILLFIWQLPQNLAGLVVLLFNFKNKKKDTISGITYWKVKHINDCGISLRNYIIMDIDRPIKEINIKHEHGHQIQSMYFGPTYLIFIGIPSALGNLYDRIAHKNWDKKTKSLWYYSQKWEASADRLGKIERTY